MSAVDLRLGDNLDVLPGIEDNSVTGVVTDSPYGLSFMGKDWDHGVPGAKYWEECLRVTKPGGSLLAFGGTRTHHRLMVAIEDAGWEIRDCLMWLYGSGFPKSHDISKAIDKAAGAEREVVGTGTHGKGSYGQGMSKETGFRPYVAGLPSENNNGQHTITAPATPPAQLWHGWGTALKPAYEPIILAMKPRDGTFANNALVHGVAGVWVDGCRVPTSGNDPNRRDNSSIDRSVDASTYNLHKRQRNPTLQQGRWPANLILDEHAAAMLDEQSGERPGSPAGTWTRNKDNGRSAYGAFEGGPRREGYGDTGGASRFFYCAKASPSERELGLLGHIPCAKCGGIDTLTHPHPKTGKPVKCRRNTHPTVKPHSLCRWLCRLVKMPGETVILDPFMGSGRIPLAGVLEGCSVIGVEIEKESFEIAQAAVNWAVEEARKPKQLEFSLDIS